MKKFDYQEMVEKGYCGDALNVEAFSEEDDDFDMFQLLNSGETVTLHGFEMVDHGDEDRKKKEREIRTHYGQLVLELRPKVQEALQRAAKENPTKIASQSWNELRMCSQSLPCCTDDSGVKQYVLVHKQYSNHSKQLNALKQLQKNVHGNYGKQCPPLYEEIKHDPNADDETKLYRHKVDWKETRHFLTEVTGVPLTDTHGPLTQLEIAKFEQKHPLLVELILRLNVLKRKVLHCRHCNTSYWDAKRWPQRDDLDDLEEGKEFEWVGIADKITRAVVEECVTNAVVRAPTYVRFKDENNKIVNVRTRSPMSTSYQDAIVGEAVLSGFAVNGELSVTTGDGQVWTATKEDQPEVDVFIALGTQVLSHLARELFAFYPPLAFHKSKINNDDDRKKWCDTRAAQLLYAVQSSGVLFNVEKTRNVRYLDGSRPKHVPNMIRLTKGLEHRIRDVPFFENGTNWLKQLYHKERLPPMVCEPSDRPMNAPDEGGYLTQTMRKRKPLVSDKTGRLHQHTPRFAPSEEAVEVINTLQKTMWTVDKDDSGKSKGHDTYTVINSVLKYELSTNLLSRLVIDLSENRPCLTFENFKGNVNNLRHGQVREWLDTFAFVEMIFSTYPGSPYFWHNWQFDWRGRMNTTTPMLSPQNDDVCRGLLRFANPVALNEEGVKWLGRFTVSLFKDINDLESLSELLADDNQSERLIENLEVAKQKKTWESYDAVAEDPLFLQLIERLLDMDIIESFQIWGQDDVFRKKAEGFQRYAAMKEFTNVMRQGGKGALSTLPVHLDASSSIYQHTSAMLKDVEMAKKVNVTATEDGSPADIYIEVRNALKEMWENDGFLEDVELSSDIKSVIKQKVLRRNVAKSPVMTTGYGAGPDSMMRALLTHNGSEDGEMNFEVDDEGQKIFYAHEQSTLGFLLDLKVDISLHKVIARAVVSGYRKAIGVVLPSFGKVLKLLKKVVDAAQKENGQPLRWTLHDGSTVSNIKWVESKAVSVKPWSGARGVRAIARDQLGSDDVTLKEAIPATMTLPVDFQGLNAKFSEDSEALEVITNLKEFEDQRFNDLRSSLVNDAIRDAITDRYGSISWGALREALNLEESDEPIPYPDMKDLVLDDVNALKTYFYPYNRTLSYFKKNTKRSIIDEKRGVAPNFVHSFDAMHMRRFVRDMKREGCTDLWSVHDSFGCHANHVEAMRTILANQFSIIHSLSSDEPNVLEGLILATTAPEKILKDVEFGQMTINDIDSAYFVN